MRYHFFFVFITILFVSNCDDLKNISKKPVKEKSTLIGKIGDQEVFLSDLEDKKINELRKELYEAIQQKFKQVAFQNLLKKHPELNISEVSISEKQIQQFYLEHVVTQQKQSNSENNRYEELKPSIQKYLQQQIIKQKVEQLYQANLAEGYIQESITPPTAWVTEIPVRNAYIRGNKSAKVMLLEFSDYQCPFCKRVQPVLENLQIKYANKVAFGYRHFPLPFHKEAKQASIAVECARKEGKFEQYHALLYDNPKRQFEQDLLKYAEQVGILDIPQFKNCLQDTAQNQLVETDIQDASSVGIQGTPAFIVGIYNQNTGIIKGELFSGVRSEQQFATLIEKYLDQ